MSTLEDPRVQRYSSPGATSLVVTANERSEFEPRERSVFSLTTTRQGRSHTTETVAGLMTHGQYLRLCHAIVEWR